MSRSASGPSPLRTRDVAVTCTPIGSTTDASCASHWFSASSAESSAVSALGAVALWVISIRLPSGETSTAVMRNSSSASRDGDALGEALASDVAPPDGAGVVVPVQPVSRRAERATPVRIAGREIVMCS